MPPKEGKAKPKRKAEEAADVEEVDEAGAPAAAKAAKKPKAEKAEKAEPKAKPAAKPLTAAEASGAVAKGASMARNAAIVKFLQGIAQTYHDNKEWIKKAGANKAVKAVQALMEPVQVARQLLALEGCGKGTVEKVTAFLEANPNASAVQQAAQAADEDAFLKDLDRDIVIGMVASGDVTLARVTAQRADISAADVA